MRFDEKAGKKVPDYWHSNLDEYLYDQRAKYTPEGIVDNSNQIGYSLGSKQVQSQEKAVLTKKVWDALDIRFSEGVPVSHEELCTIKYGDFLKALELAYKAGQEVQELEKHIHKCPGCGVFVTKSPHHRPDGELCNWVYGRRGWRVLGEYDG